MKTYHALMLGFLAACAGVALTIWLKQFVGPAIFAPFVLVMVAGVFLFVNTGRGSLCGIPAAVFYIGTFFYVFILAGGIGLGFFSLR